MPLCNPFQLAADNRRISHHQIGIFPSTDLWGICDTSLDASAARTQVAVRIAAEAPIRGLDSRVSVILQHNEQSWIE